MVRFQRFLAIPMAATAVGCLWLLWRLGGPTALQIGLVTAAMFAALLGGAGLQRKGAQTGYVATLLAVGHQRRRNLDLGNIMTDRAATAERERQGGCVERSDGQGRPGRRQAGVRLFPQPTGA